MLAQMMGATAALTEQPELMRIIGACSDIPLSIHTHTRLLPPIHPSIHTFIHIHTCPPKPTTHPHTQIHTQTDVNIRRNFGPGPSPPLFAAPLYWGREATREFLDAAAARYPETRWGTRQVGTDMMVGEGALFCVSG